MQLLDSTTREAEDPELYASIVHGHRYGNRRSALWLPSLYGGYTRQRTVKGSGERGEFVGR